MWRTPYVLLSHAPAATQARWDPQKHGAAASLDTLIFEVAVMTRAKGHPRDPWKRHVCDSDGKDRDPRVYSDPHVHKAFIVEFFRLLLKPFDARNAPPAAATAAGSGDSGSEWSGHDSLRDGTGTPPQQQQQQR